MDQLDLFSTNGSLTNDQLWLLSMVGDKLGDYIAGTSTPRELCGFGWAPIYIDGAPTWAVSGFSFTANGIRSQGPGSDKGPTAISITYVELGAWIQLLPNDLRKAIAQASTERWGLLHRKNQTTGQPARTLNRQFVAAEQRLQTLLSIACCPTPHPATHVPAPTRAR